VLREILGKNVHVEDENQFTQDGEIHKMKIENEKLVDLLGKLISKYECRVQLMEILMCQKNKNMNKIERGIWTEDVKKLNLEDLKDKKIYKVKLAEEIEKGKFLEEMETTRFIKLQKNMPKKYYDVENLEAIEMNKTGHIMETILNA
jgi:hypothetical protein